MQQNRLTENNLKDLDVKIQKEKELIDKRNAIREQRDQEKKQVDTLK